MQAVSHCSPPNAGWNGPNNACSSEIKGGCVGLPCLPSAIDCSLGRVSQLFSEVFSGDGVLEVNVSSRETRASSSVRIILVRGGCGFGA